MASVERWVVNRLVNFGLSFKINMIWVLDWCNSFEWLVEAHLFNVFCMLKYVLHEFDPFRYKQQQAVSSKAAHLS